MASRAWLAREESGALLTHFRRSRGARLHRCNSRRKHRCFGSDGRCCCSCARRSTSFPRCRLAFKQRHGRAGVRRRRGMCLGGGQDAVRASRARIGVTCTNRALQRAACSIFPQGSLCGRGVSCCPLLRCWPSAGPLLSLLTLTLTLTQAHSLTHSPGMLGVGKGAGCVALSQIRPCTISPVRIPNLHRTPGPALVIVRTADSY